MELLDINGYVSYQSFVFFEKKIRPDSLMADKYLSIIADLIRYNTLLSIARAGTGHLGASLSIVELLTEIYFRSFGFSPEKLKSKDRDIFILSKGHAAPSLYATLAAKGYFPIENLDRLRRLSGLPGHCDIETKGIEANTGSLGMGLSKAVGYAIAKKRFGMKGNVIVIIGNGELQEGQCWEAFLSAVSFKLDNLYVIIDDNKVQTDRLTKDIVQYGQLLIALKNMGFAVMETDGQSVSEINKSLKSLKRIKNKPKLFWSQTIKGQRVSFMEHPTVLRNKVDRYLWHNKAPNREQLGIALNEIINRNIKILNQLGFQWDLTSSLSNIPITPMQTNINGDNLIVGLRESLVEAGEKYRNIVVLNADLEEDCGFVQFHQKFTKRFFEMGIMEQNLVSATAALSRMGYLPVFSSYAAFLTSRANEQLYNLASEGAKALIIGNMAGILPATPEKSHSGFRDIACIKNIPGIFMYQPINQDDTKNILRRYFRNELGRLLYLRLSMIPSAVELSTPDKNIKKGFPQILRRGKDILIIGIGPVILGECMLAADKLAKKGIEVEIWNYPWITDFDRKTILKISERGIPLLIVEDHYMKGGFGESLLAFLSEKGIKFIKIRHLALKDFPKTGFRQEALQYYGLNQDSLIRTISNLLR